jgi:hypothetical protein
MSSVPWSLLGMGVLARPPCSEGNSDSSNGKALHETETAVSVKIQRQSVRSPIVHANITTCLSR